MTPTQIISLKRRMPREEVLYAKRSFCAGHILLHIICRLTLFRWPQCLAAADKCSWLRHASLISAKEGQIWHDISAATLLRHTYAARDSPPGSSATQAPCNAPWRRCPRQAAPSGRLHRHVELPFRRCGAAATAEPHDSHRCPATQHALADILLPRHGCGAHVA